MRRVPLEGATTDALGIKKGKLAALLKGYAKANIPATAISSLRRKAKIENETLMEKLSEMIRLVEDFGLRPAAKMLGVDPSNLSRKLIRK